MQNMDYRKLSLGVLLMLVVAVGSSSSAQDIDRDALVNFLDHPDKPIYVRGDYFRAIQVAYVDFAKVLARRGTKAPGSGDEDNGEYLRMAKIENYDIYIEESGSAYRIHIAPTRRAPLHEVFGGGATYTIDRASFTITNVTLSK